MAETKRGVTSGRVATPKIPSQAHGGIDLAAAMSKAIGARIKITTTQTTTLAGTLFTYCPVTSLIAINTAPAPPTPKSTLASFAGDYRVIPLSQIQSFTTLAVAKDETVSSGGASGVEGAQTSIPKIDFKSLAKREKDAIEEIKKRNQARGKGVSKEGQAIYDALARTLPTRWAGDQIVVSDAVVIKPPYTVDDCNAPKAQHNALARVKKVLEKERQKLAVKLGTQPVAVPAGPRKGG